MLILLILFILKEYIDRQADNQEDLDLLRKVFRYADQIERNLEDYLDRLNKNAISAPSIVSFDVDLPLKVNKKSIGKLDDLLFSANDKIETLNDRRGEIVKILVDISLNDKKRNDCVVKYSEIVSATLNQTVIDLREILKEIKKELLKWKIF